MRLPEQGTHGRQAWSVLVVKAPRAKGPPPRVEAAQPRRGGGSRLPRNEATQREPRASWRPWREAPLQTRDCLPGRRPVATWPTF